MNYQSNLAFESKILLDDTDLIVNFCLVQDTLKPKLNKNRKMDWWRTIFFDNSLIFTCAEPDSMPEQCFEISP